LERVASSYRGNGFGKLECCVFINKILFFPSLIVCSCSDTANCFSFIFWRSGALSIPSENSESKNTIQNTINITINMTSGMHSVGTGCGLMYLTAGYREKAFLLLKM
jgi:hypothetical protein